MTNLLIVFLLMFTTPQKDVSVQKAQKLMKQKNVVVLDVRTKAEQDSGYIKKAVFIDYKKQDFKQKIQTLDKSKTYVVYCKSGRRSAETLTLMTSLGFTNVYNVLGGIDAWRKAKLPEQKPAAAY